jgi:hypothetical protein
LSVAAALVITIDTEEDCWGDFRSHANPVDNIGQIPMLQALFDHFGAVPTYLVNWPVIMDDGAAAILRGIHASGRCEIGSHCHPWNTPPFDESITNRNSMLCNLPSGLVKAKLSNLYNATADRLQVEPQSFRAGRWGFGQDVASGLIEAGYRVDSSVCPGVDWGGDFGPDYSNAPDTPYRFRADDILRPDRSGELLEVPATTSFLQRNLPLCRSLRRTLSKAPAKKFHLLGLLDRLKLLNFRWLSPELTSGADMIRLCRAMLERGSPTLNMSFHSTTLLPGKSPYVRSQEDLDVFLERIRAVLEFSVQNQVRFSALSSLRGQMSQSRDTG